MTNQEKIDLVIKKHQSTGKLLKIDGIKTFVCDVGSGEPVLCIHGVPTSSFLYRKVINSLAKKGHRGICVDFPGLGLSDRPENFEYSFSNLADFLAKAMDHMKISHYHLVVHDVGGPIGFALAANNRDRIKSLTI